MKINILRVILFLVLLKSGTLNLHAQIIHYRTNDSGSWSNPEIWETSVDDGFEHNVVKANAPPSYLDGKIIISPETVITINSNVQVDELVISNQASLILLSGNRLEVMNGDGIDLLVEGSLEDKTAAGSGISFFGSTWALGSHGTFIKYSTSSSTVLRDNYHHGMANIPATANWIIRRETASGTPRFSSIDTYYPNLTFENMVADHWDPGSLSNRFSGIASNVVIKGNLNIGGQGIGSLTVYNENRNAQPLIIGGNLTVNKNSIITNDGNVPGTGIKILGNIYNEGEINLNSGEGILQLDNINPITIAGSGKIETQKAMNSGAIFLENTLIVHKELALSGKVDVLNNKICITEEGTISNESDLHRIIGTVEVVRNINHTVNTFGNVGFEMDAPTVDLGFTRVTRTTGESVLLGSSHNPSIHRIWKVQTEKRPSQPLKINLFWNTSDETGHATEAFYLFIRNKKDDDWHVTTDQADFGEQTASFETMFQFGMQDESQKGVLAFYTIGEGGSPLPVNWLSFHGQRKNESVFLYWSTASEKDNKVFDIQRSKDGTYWKHIGSLKGAGNSTEIRRYQFENSNFLNSAYYRIKQIDFNGEFSYSKIIFVPESNSAKRFAVYPNPVKNQLHISDLKTKNPNELMSIHISNKEGKVLLNCTGILSELIEKTNDTLKKISAGIYLLQLKTGGTIEAHRLAVHH